MSNISRFKEYVTSSAPRLIYLFYFIDIYMSIGVYRYPYSKHCPIVIKISKLWTTILIMTASMDTTDLHI